MKKPKNRRKRSQRKGNRTPKQTNATDLLKPGQKYLTRNELAHLLHVSVRKVDSMVANREIPVLHLGLMVRFRLEDVERHLNETMLTDAEQGDSDLEPVISNQSSVNSFQ